jgi:hypothetical protein
LLDVAEGAGGIRGDPAEIDYSAEDCREADHRDTHGGRRFADSFYVHLVLLVATLRVEVSNNWKNMPATTFCSHPQ